MKKNQRIHIHISGPKGIGKTTVNDLIANALLDDGYMVEVENDGNVDVAPTKKKRKPFVFITENEK
jgi:nucleoside-triphosphatase THEP1